MLKIERKLITSGSKFEEELAYSRAVVDGQMISVSGTTGYDYNTMKISENVMDQADQTIRNIESVLIDAGSSFTGCGKGLIYILPEASEYEKLANIKKILCKHNTSSYNDFGQPVRYQCEG